MDLGKKLLRSLGFDTEKFIQEVKCRKAIWDTTCTEYSDRLLRRRQWEELEDIFGGIGLNQLEKRELGRNLQKKWKNLRTCFTRELRRIRTARRGQVPARKSSYIFYEHLLFLKNAPRKREEIYLTSPSEDDDDDPVEQQSLEPQTNDQKPLGPQIYELKSLDPQTYDQKSQICVQPISESQTYDQMILDIPTTNHQEILETQSSHEDSVAISKKNQKKSDGHSNMEFMNVQKSETFRTERETINLDVDEDKMFLLSLLSSFRKTPDHQKSSTKIELIQLIENIQYDEDKMFLNSLLSSFKKIPEEKKAAAKIELIQVIEKAQCSNTLIKVESETRTSWDSGL